MTSMHREWLDSAFTWVRSRIADPGADPGVAAAEVPPDPAPAVEVDPPVLGPGATLAGLRIERRIAEGASGAQLFAAVAPIGGQTFAMKVFDLKALPSGADEAHKRFVHECGVAASLQHPDIVRVYGSGEEAGRAYLVMELLTGSNLTRYTKPPRLLPEPEVLRIGARVAGALAYAHAHGVIHRDIKPANVMFDAGRNRVTITDFGIASLAHADHRPGQRRAVIGSPASMAPEQLTDGQVDGRADLYALGLLLYQMLTGRLPYDAKTIPQLTDAIVHGRITRLADRRGDLPVQLYRLVDRLLDKLPSRRPDNADRVAQALQALSTRLAHAEAPRRP
jgi:serine/threonine-protein kinase